MRRAAAVIPIPMRGSPAGPLLLIALLGCAASCARAGFTTAPDDVAGDGVVDHTAERSTDAPPADGGDSGQDQAAPDGPPAPGTHRWARRIGRAGAVESLALASDASGNVIAAGTFRGQIDLGGGDLLGGAGREVFLASFSAEGDHRWSRAFGGSGDDQALDVAGGPGGRIVVSGRFAGVVDFGGVQPDIDHAAVFRQRTELVIRQIAIMGADGHTS